MGLKNTPPGRVSRKQLNRVAPSGCPVLPSSLPRRGVTFRQKRRTPMIEVLAHLYDTSRAGQGISFMRTVRVLTHLPGQEMGDLQASILKCSQRLDTLLLFTK